jgi:hypothetical protein
MTKPGRRQAESTPAPPATDGWQPEGGPIELELEPPEPFEFTPAELPAPRGPEILVVEKHAFQVRLRLIDGEVLAGDIFLLQSPEGNPQEALLQWLHELRDGFFPLREPNGELPMVHTRALRWLAAPCESCQHEFLSAKRHVRLVLAHGEVLEGTVGLDIETQGPRLSDLLNEFRPYLSLQTPHELFLVNRGTVSRAYDLGPEKD